MRYLLGLSIATLVTVVILGVLILQRQELVVREPILFCGPEQNGIKLCTEIEWWK